MENSYLIKRELHAGEFENKSDIAKVEKEKENYAKFVSSINLNNDLLKTSEKMIKFPIKLRIKYFFKNFLRKLNKFL